MSERGDNLSEAWADAEAALPEGAWISQLAHPWTDTEWHVEVRQYDQAEEQTASIIAGANGPTPAAALRALAAKFRERQP